MTTPLDTEQLLESLAKGDRTATEFIYKQHFNTINGWLIKNGSSVHDAADLFQEAMVVLFGKAKEADFRLTCNVGTYLFAVSKHLWYKKVEQHRKDPVSYKDNRYGDEDDGLLHEDDVSVHEERERHYEQLDTALEQIGEPCRSLLKAYYHQDRSMQEIAAEFGYTNPENAKNQKYKCLTRLRKIFHNAQA